MMIHSRFFRRFIYAAFINSCLIVDCIKELSQISRQTAMISILIAIEKAIRSGYIYRLYLTLFVASRCKYAAWRPDYSRVCDNVSSRNYIFSQIAIAAVARINPSDFHSFLRILTPNYLASNYRDHIIATKKAYIILHYVWLCHYWINL